MSREEIVTAARVEHDKACRCDPRYVMSCPRLAAAVLDLWLEPPAPSTGGDDGARVLRAALADAGTDGHDPNRPQAGPTVTESDLLSRLLNAYLEAEAYICGDRCTLPDHGGCCDTELVAEVRAALTTKPTAGGPTVTDVVIQECRMTESPTPAPAVGEAVEVCTYALWDGSCAVGDPDRICGRFIVDGACPGNPSHYGAADLSGAARDAALAEAARARAEVERAIALLKTAADGRAEYAVNAPEDMARILTCEAAALNSAARIVQGDLQPLYGLLPSWRWDAAGLPEPRAAALSDAGTDETGGDR